MGRSKSAFGHRARTFGCDLLVVQTLLIGVDAQRQEGGHLDRVVERNVGGSEAEEEGAAEHVHHAEEEGDL